MDIFQIKKTKMQDALIYVSFIKDERYINTSYSTCKNSIVITDDGTALR